MKFGFNWSSGFRGEDLLKWLMDNDGQTTMDAKGCLYYKLTL